MARKDDRRRLMPTKAKLGWMVFRAMVGFLFALAVLPREPDLGFGRPDLRGPFGAAVLGTLAAVRRQIGEAQEPGRFETQAVPHSARH